MILRRLLALLLLCAAALPAQAAVTITFYSHEFGSSFPHAFILLEGAPDAGGAPVSGNYGFTAKRVTPAILMGSVEGDIESAGPAYVGNSRPHWRMTLSDGQYAAVLAVMQRWNAIPGRSYNLNRRNCVHFVADMARTLGLDVVEPKELMLKPRSFLQSLLARNAALQVPVDGMATIAAGAPTAPATPSGQAEPAPIPTLRATALATVDPAVPLSAPPVAAAMAEGSRSMSRGGGTAAPAALPR
ncbi:MAG: hypothetical protein JWL91_1541 [Sphingomonas bacterium]|nr:hypothetical protein [Sphingomonas bacterium]MDB5689665.1 hypothetical protein [Sphingomonas bacterium]